MSGGSDKNALQRKSPWRGFNLRSRALAVGIYGKNSVRSRFGARGRLVGGHLIHLGESVKASVRVCERGQGLTAHDHAACRRRARLRHGVRTRCRLRAVLPSESDEFYAFASSAIFLLVPMAGDACPK